MANDNANLLEVDSAPESDDELHNLFLAFDEVSASGELKDATLARIFALAGEDAGADAETVTTMADGTAGGASPTSSPTATVQVKAVSGGKAGKAVRRSKWRAIRVAAIAACLALALTGGIAYAMPATYYEVEQDGTTITLGVNCFGITVRTTSDSEDGAGIIESTDLRGMPYEESLARAIESMEERNPDKPVEYGPQGGEHKVIEPQAQAPQGEGVPQGDPGSGGEPQSGQSQPEPDGQSRDADHADGPEGPSTDRQQGEGREQGRGSDGSFQIGDRA